MPPRTKERGGTHKRCSIPKEGLHPPLTLPTRGGSRPEKTNARLKELSDFANRWNGRRPWPIGSLLSPPHEVAQSLGKPPRLAAPKTRKRDVIAGN